jgi:hypothetical protein
LRGGAGRFYRDWKTPAMPAVAASGQPTAAEPAEPGRRSVGEPDISGTIAGFALTRTTRAPGRPRSTTRVGTGEMTTSELSTTVPADTATHDECVACPHPLHDHDDLGTRFCAATTSSALSRACICR